MISRAGEHPVVVSEEEKDRILYIELPIGDDKLMGSDVFETFGQSVKTGNHNYISISTDTKEEADRLFYSLSEGGEVEMPINEQFFGYFGSFKDKFGINWMVISTT